MERSALRSNFLHWINSINQEKQPGDDVIAFNFGILESVNGYSIYLTGSKEYDRDDDDWACNEDYIPENKYLNLPESYTNESWEDVQNIVIETIDSYLNSSAFGDSFMRNAKAITTGFDDGGLVRIK